MIREGAWLAAAVLCLAHGTVCAQTVESTASSTTTDESALEASAEGEGQAAIAAGAEADGAPVEEHAASGSVDASASIDGAADDGELAAQLRTRQDIVMVHRAFGVATWLSMAVTAVFGWIQFGDEYGFHSSANETACANGDAVFQDFCSPNVPWAHAILGFTTAALYFTTAGISFAIPSPLEASADVELHKTLRWFHLASMLATAVFGVVTANLDIDDFQTRQALAITHQALGVTTFGLLTAAAAVVVF